MTPLEASIAALTTSLATMKHERDRWLVLKPSDAIATVIRTHAINDYNERISVLEGALADRRRVYGDEA